MRRRTAAAVVIASAGIVAVGAMSAACFDLFHSTADILTACEIDGQSPACRQTTDFCQWTPAESREHAQHACAWLGACEAPMGGDALGPCMFQALLAYDCAANPNHRSRDPAHRIWDCLWQAQSCDDVAACVPPADDGGSACSQSGCFGTQLRWCDGGDDVGIDCAGYGTGQCSGYPTTNHPTWVACVADSDAGACAPDPTARCANGVAQSCPSGFVETIDCQALLGPRSACLDGRLDPPFDWTSPCAVVPPVCTLDSCTDAGSAIGCARGAAFAVDCASEHLGACRMVSPDAGTEQHAACSPP